MVTPDVNGNVELIDPIDSVSRLPSELNGTPEYEKMFTFVSMRARRRPRSVIVNDGKAVTVEDSLDEININMLGFDQETGQYTTRWGNNIDNTRILYEGFGISNINIKTNSSYIPKVSVDFIDIRGSTFFNLGERSPYSVLFDFPPPIFELTVKGYYGRVLTYQLHLVDHSTKFDSENGNFIISANFIARTFAPLTDVPFKYIDIFPLINFETSPQVDVNVQRTITGGDGTLDTSRQNISNAIRPRNTHELILKLQSLYDDIAELRETSEEATAVRNIQLEINRGNSAIERLNNFSNFLSTELYQNISVIFIKELIDDDGDSGGQLTEITNIAQYNSVIQADSTIDVNENKNERLFLSICLDRETSNSDPRSQNTSQITEENIIQELRTLKINLIEFIDDTVDITNSDIGDPEIVRDFNVQDNSQFINADDSVKYIGIDVTRYYLKLKKYIDEKNKLLIDSQGLLVGKANQAAISNLGMRPTIYNIFEIICDDIDRFFNILRRTTVSAEEHHNRYENLILDQVVDTRIGAFPLYVSASTTNCVRRESRAIPIDLSNRVEDATGNPFPEIELIDDFINAFIRIEKEELVSELRTQEDSIGNNIWIPVTPADSELFGNDKESPYTRIEFQYQNLNVNQKINKIYNKIIERFYVASQYTYGKQFYQENPFIVQLFSENELRNIDIIKFAAGAEAANLAQSLTDLNTINTLRSKADQFKNNATIDVLFQEFENSVPSYSRVISSFPNPTSEFVTIGNTRGITFNDNFNTENIAVDVIDLYKNRENENFNGVKILSDVPLVRNNSGNNTLNPVDNYLDNDSTWIQGVYDFLRGGSDTPREFSSENILFIKDSDPESDFTTKYIDGFINPPVIPVSIIQQPLPIYSFKNSFTNTWSTVFAKDNFGNELLDILTGGTINNSVQAFFIASSFLKTRSYYHRLSSGRYQLNDSFIFPAINEVPYFSVLYMGGLIRYIENEGFRNEFNTMVTAFTRNFSFDFVNLLIDADNIENLMASRDKDEFRAFFSDFDESSNFFSLRNNLIDLLNAVKNTQFNPNLIDRTLNVTQRLFVGAELNSTEQLIADEFKNQLENTYKGSITEFLNQKYAVVVANQFAFSVLERDEFGNFIDDPTEIELFQPLSVTNSDPNRVNANRVYFTEFFRVLSENIRTRQEEVEDIENRAIDSINDNDIKGQLYYSFKSISDKWIAGLGGNINGFPLNRNSNERLIDKFMFVDRAMNPIGDDCIINVEPLLDLAQDFDVNVFSVFSQILSHNGFEFFPLQNFMSFDRNNWEDSFKTFESINQDSIPAFVCMYIGGASSILDSQSSDFDDDGIQDLTAESLPDFKNNDCNTDEVVGGQNIDTNINQPYSQVKAFRVRYAEQNQSFFNAIELDGRDFTETNDSLAILSKIAGDESKTSPVPKGQNLYSIYENRAYSSKVTILGNMLIQPTQYFQLENIPMYSGAYMILDVEHNFTPNHIITKFQGVRILKFPNPIVTEFATVVGFQSGTAEDISASLTLEEIRNSPLYEDARRNGLVDSILTPVTSLTWDDETNNKILELHPLIRQRATNFVNRLDNEFNIRVRITSGLRTWDQQARLFNQGRTTPGNIVTNARAGESYHNYGLALDVVEINNGVALYDNPNWEFIGSIGIEEGFFWGGNFTTLLDLPHFEARFNLTTNQIRTLFNNGDRVGVYVIIPKENLT